ncbi:MAG: methionyl-tRNA formyltransferase [Proteobacteria bacterium]|nr:methionyl-tRNA formyltransferase [Pseudomonadota bacterium]
MLKIVFMGSPEFAVPTLEALVADPRCQVCAVITQPDKPAGRGRLMTPPAVKQCAEAHAIPCYQPPILKTPEMFDLLTDLAPDFFVTIAYGKILRQAFLDIPRLAPLNLHASLLPKYRGAAPIQWAIMQGETTSGVCLMRMDAGMDTGPVYARQAIDLAPSETAATLHEKLAALSAQVLTQNIHRIANGSLTPVPQDGEPSAAPILQKSHGYIHFDTDAHALDARCRGLFPWPTAVVTYQGKRIAIHMTHALETHVSSPPGTILGLCPDSKALLVACKQGILAIHTLQPEGKKPMDAKSFFHGYRPEGEQFLPLV